MLAEEGLSAPSVIAPMVAERRALCPCRRGDEAAQRLLALGLEIDQGEALRAQPQPEVGLRLPPADDAVEAVPWERVGRRRAELRVGLLVAAAVWAADVVVVAERLLRLERRAVLPIEHVARDEHLRELDRPLERALRRRRLLTAARALLHRRPRRGRGLVRGEARRRAAERERAVTRRVRRRRRARQTWRRASRGCGELWRRAGRRARSHPARPARR